MRKNKLTILVDEGYNNEYLEFLNLFITIKKTYTFEEFLKGNISDKIDLTLFTGGEDVNPSMYNENVGMHTNINTNRDIKSRSVYNSLSYLVPKLGICRGAQFLTVMNGGKLIQHVNGHTSSHQCDGKLYGEIIQFNISSTHHQMMYPFNLDNSKYDILAWSKKYMSDTYLNGDNLEIKLDPKFLEPEIVYYKSTNSLAIQGHPEFENVNNRDKSIIYDYIRTHLIFK